MNQQLFQKVLQRHGLQEAFRKLSEDLSTSELTTILSSVFAERLSRQGPHHLHRKIDEDRFVGPSTISPERFHAFDTHVYQTLPAEFRPVELSPLAPLGTVELLAPVDAALVMHTVRSQEVLSDSTNMLAILAAKERHGMSDARTTVNLCASHRLVRTQMPLHKGHTAHFRILSLVSAGRDRGSYAFELEHLRVHLEFYLRLLKSFNEMQNISIEIVLKEYQDTGIDWYALEHSIRHYGVTWKYERVTRAEWSYYAPFQFNINLNYNGQFLNLGDGGMTDWTQRLLSDQKERLLISGFGSELFCKLILNDPAR